MARYRVLKTSMESTDFRHLKKVNWCDVTEGDTVFTTELTNTQEKLCYGPFKVISTCNRVLENTLTGRTFFEYPETLLIEADNGKA